MACCFSLTKKAYLFSRIFSLNFTTFYNFQALLTQLLYIHRV